MLKGKQKNIDVAAPFGKITGADFKKLGDGDQLVSKMYGGKVMWLLDPVFASMDSIQNKENTVSVENDVDLQSQLFNYGVRLNRNLVLDLSGLPIPIRTGQVGGQAQIDFFPWYYF